MECSSKELVTLGGGKFGIAFDVLVEEGVCI